MKLIIDIPEEAYNLLKTSGVDWLGAEHILDAVSKGTPLPEGHGDLIDRSEVIKNLFDYHNGKKTIGQCIDDVPTIIEADVPKKRKCIPLEENDSGYNCENWIP